MKNLVLCGVSVTLCDIGDCPVTADDCAHNFFLRFAPQSDHTTSSRLEASVEEIRALNSMTSVTLLPVASSSTLTHDMLNEYSVVLIDDASIPTSVSASS